MKPLVIAVLSAVVFLPVQLAAHCDGLDGPVVQAARKALETGNLNLALVWVQAAHEAEIRAAFDRTRAVRGQSSEARELADLYFFETLVRVHRAGEGAPYTGLKPAGRDLGPAVPAADKAVVSGIISALLEMLLGSVRNGVEQRFREVTAAQKHHDNDDLNAGRRYVQAYVEFLHYTERIHQAAVGSAESHSHEPEP